MWIKTNWKILKEMKIYQTTLLAPEKRVCKKQQLKPDIEQQTGSKLRQEYIKAVYCHPVYLTYMHNTS